MTIARIHVEGGFLNGLDLQFKPGLNVIIGARGTGKTSVIELIRYGFGAKNQTSESAEQSIKHARATLADGEVVLKIDDLLDTVTLTRSATEDGPRTDGLSTYNSPIIFSQKEVENIALSERGRLNLVDGFIQDRSTLNLKELSIKEELVAINNSISPLMAEIERIKDGILNRESLLEELEQLKSQQHAYSALNEVDSAKQARVAELSELLNELKIQEDDRNDFIQRIESFIEPVIRVGYIDPLSPERFNSDLALRKLYAELDATVASINASASRLRGIQSDASKEIVRLRHKRVATESKFREARQEIDAAIEGAGVIEKKLLDVKQQLSRIESQSISLSERNIKIADLRAHRETLLDQLETVRRDRYESRKRVVDHLNEVLGPRIKVSIAMSAQYDQYVKSLIESLRGSGLKYNDIASTLVQTVSPRELMKYVESGNIEALSQASGIARERCLRIINVMTDTGLSDMLIAPIEDTVRLRLLDGTEYKDIGMLSAGQRCTVTLPIILQHSDRVLVIDQPEDHIDNAFIVETLIRSLRGRSEGSQIILATHNANIPVLGNADWVVQMVSDGRHGSVAVASDLEDRAAVHAITSIMEGGVKAFRDRAEFYNGRLS